MSGHTDTPAGAPADAPGDHEGYCAAAEAEIARFVELVEEADPATPVPTCPGWTMAALAEHLGSTHRWAAHILRNRVQEPVRSRDIEVEPPDAGSGHAAWVAAGAGRLLAALRDADRDVTTWTWAGDRRVDWWSRRMLHEALVHRADAELALGREPSIGAHVAVDGIDEFLANLGSAGRVAERLPEVSANGDTLHFHSTDAEGEWMIGIGPDGFTWAPGHGKATVAARGPAAGLLLLVYGRVPASEGRCEVLGDEGLLERWLKATAF
jgi:uncharacterized protein (TIGR03083 family)